jgi:hypothetical protein
MTASCGQKQENLSGQSIGYSVKLKTTGHVADHPVGGQPFE